MSRVSWELFGFLLRPPSALSLSKPTRCFPSIFSMSPAVVTTSAVERIAQLIGSLPDGSIAVGDEYVVWGKSFVDAVVRFGYFISF
jgi:hypothetical protein